MYEAFKDETKPIQIKIPWNKNTAIGFTIAICLCVLLILLISSIKNNNEQDEKQKQNIALTLVDLSFGNGDGTGGNHGNLSEEGKANKGQKPTAFLEDASKLSNNHSKNPTSIDDASQSSNIHAIKDNATSDKSDKSKDGSDNKNTGSPNGTQSGSGLGNQGIGSGEGSGLGAIDWGGGGNRTVLFKKLPKYPPGINIRKGNIKIRFTVLADGTVSRTIPLEKADPLLERAAMDALRQWRFNPLKDNREMAGIITITFIQN